MYSKQLLYNILINKLSLMKFELNEEMDFQG